MTNAPGGSILADLAVNITAKGVEQSDKAIDGVRKKIDEVAKAEKRAELAGRGFTKQLLGGVVGISQRIGGLVRQFSFGNALGLGGVMSVGGIAAGALRNTVEAERLGRALDFLARALGDELAPAVRAVTGWIIQAAQWYRSLDKGTRQAVAGIAILVTGLGALATAVTAVVAFVTTVGAIPIAVGVAAAAVAFLAAVCAEVALSIPGVTAALTALFDSLVRGLNKLWVVVKSLMTAVGAAAGVAMPDVMKNGAASLGRATARVWDKVAAMVKALAGNGPGMTRRFNAGFEQGQQTWERLQRAFAERDTALLSPALEQVKQLKDLNQKADGIAGLFAGVMGVLRNLQPVR